MDPNVIYQEWLCSPYLDEQAKQELLLIQSNLDEIQDRFSRHIEFGTAGVRGLLGAGRNRINRYTIRRITRGLIASLEHLPIAEKDKGVVIAYDNRHQSRELALETAHTLLDHGIRAYLFPSECPTPLLSYAIRELKTLAGVVITASHNPPEYNGYKIFSADGGQITPPKAQEISHYLEHISEIPENNETLSLPHHDIQWLDHMLEERYIAHLKKLLLHPEVLYCSSLRTIYSPLHGVGGKLVQKAFAATGYSNYRVVPEQAEPDPEFSTVSSPNPEDPAAFALAVSLGKKEHADLLIATDPDCDRTGVAVKQTDGEYIFLSGNQTGALLLYYLLTEKKQRFEKGVMIQTVVTSPLSEKIAIAHGLEVRKTLTGFKYIGEQIEQIEQSGEETFVFGYEESFGYLAGTFVRDKDGVMATLLLTEMAAYYHEQQKTLIDVLEEIYQQYGYFAESIHSFTLKGETGRETMQEIMTSLREHPPRAIGSIPIYKIADYGTQKEWVTISEKTHPLPYPKENSLQFTLEDGSWFCVRPSGTEPKMKIYFSAQGNTREECQEKLEVLQQEVVTLIKQLEIPLIKYINQN